LTFLLADESISSTGCASTQGISGGADFLCEFGDEGSNKGHELTGSSLGGNRRVTDEEKYMTLYERVGSVRIMKRRLRRGERSGGIGKDKLGSCG
jgi:hypothetical protein